MQRCRGYVRIRDTHTHTHTHAHFLVLRRTSAVQITLAVANTSSILTSIYPHQSPLAIDLSTLSWNTNTASVLPSSSSTSCSPSRPLISLAAFHIPTYLPKYIHTLAIIMTVPLPTPSNPKADAAVRKRRRRAPAGGAADDCFTCTKRGLKCDRRRPYCSQCLEVGNDCSGYKTQLTWGVGVASRGKLRGLSLPIAKSPPVQPVKKTSPSRARANSTAAGPNGANARWNDRESISPRSTRDVIIDGPVDHRRPHPLSLPTTPYLGYDLSKMSHPGDTSPSHSPAGQSWHNIPFPTTDGSRYPKLTPILAHHSHGPPEPLSSSIESLSDADYLSPLSHTFSRDDLPFVHSPSVMYAESYAGTNSPVPQSPVSAMMIDHQRAPTSCPSLVYAPSEPSSSLHSHHMDAFEAHLSNRMMEYEPLGEISWSPHTTHLVHLY